MRNISHFWYNIFRKDSEARSLPYSDADKWDTEETQIPLWVRMPLLQHPPCSSKCSLRSSPHLILPCHVCGSLDPQQSDKGTRRAPNNLPTISHGNLNTGCASAEASAQKRGWGTTEALARVMCSHFVYMIYDQMQNLLLASCGNLLTVSVPQFPYLDMKLVVPTHKVARVQWVNLLKTCEAVPSI